MNFQAGAASPTSAVNLDLASSTSSTKFCCPQAGQAPFSAETSLYKTPLQLINNRAPLLCLQARDKHTNRPTYRVVDVEPTIRGQHDDTGFRYTANTGSSIPRADRPPHPFGNIRVCAHRAELHAFTSGTRLFTDCLLEYERLLEAPDPVSRAGQNDRWSLRTESAWRGKRTGSGLGMPTAQCQRIETSLVCSNLEICQPATRRPNGLAGERTFPHFWRGRAANPRTLAGARSVSVPGFQGCGPIPSGRRRLSDFSGHPSPEESLCHIIRLAP